MIKAFATGTGSNLLTITCADPETFAGATADPDTPSPDPRAEVSEYLA